MIPGAGAKIRIFRDASLARGGSSTTAALPPAAASSPGTATAGAAVWRPPPLSGVLRGGAVRLEARRPRGPRAHEAA